MRSPAPCTGLPAIREGAFSKKREMSPGLSEIGPSLLSLEARSVV